MVTSNSQQSPRRKSAWIARFGSARLIGEKRWTGGIQASNATLVKSLTMSDGGKRRYRPFSSGSVVHPFPGHRKHTDMPDRGAGCRVVNDEADVKDKAPFDAGRAIFAVRSQEARLLTPKALICVQRAA